MYVCIVIELASVFVDCETHPDMGYADEAESVDCIVALLSTKVRIISPQ